MAAVQTAPKRTEYLNFWNKYSDKPTHESMLLNNNAHELEESDRADVVAALPDYTGKDVADIGSGIGRFTTLFSQKARKVISTDFIESFVNKNKERNASAKNIEFVVSDAAGLELEDASMDLVFTNWLFMYLSDSECVDFTLKALRWLRPGGYFKLRESCSEPSTGRRKGNAVHATDAANPTHYRYKSLYLLLLTNARFQDADGKWFKFEVEWGTSIPTYITLANNWRQVHWLAKKVEIPAPVNGEISTQEALLNAFSTSWPAEQVAFDALVSGDHVSWTHKIMAPQVSASLGATVLAYSPRVVDATAAVDTFALVDESTTTNFWTIELNPLAFRASNTKATEKRDQHQRFAWHANLQSAVTYLSVHNTGFDGFVGTELLSTATIDEVLSLKTVLNSKAQLLLLEPTSETTVNTDALKSAGFTIDLVEDVTTAAHDAINDQISQGTLKAKVAKGSLSASWTVIKATKP
uniref:phosphoethanolamine N-methyltransferase n=1 Tax=Panagrellus redivivus TaxID=6233 RepID=A0A7E4ZUS1_PANRE